MHKKIVILLVFMLFCSTVIPFTLGIEPIQNYGETPEIPYQDGWPQKTLNKIVSKPVVADLDADGTKEIIVGSGEDGYKNFLVYVFHHNGSYISGWPKKVSSGMYGSPAIGDIDDDGDLEIIMTDEDYVYAWHHDGTLVSGWPISIGYCASSPTLYDLDQDHDLEVIISCGERINFYDRATVHIWHHDGTYVEGWPQIITEYDYSIVEYGSPAVGDINNDGTAEIIVGIRLSDDYDPAHGYVYVWHPNGTIMDGWPVPTMGWVESAPALADLDDDEDLEIILGTFAGKVVVLHHDATNVEGWPQDCSSWLQDPAVADIDQDGILEIICVTVAYGSVHIWKANGTPLPGWPQDTDGRYIWESPIVGDISGDGHLEVLIKSSSKLYAWYHNGSRVPGFPLSTGGSGSTPCLGDIDGDGDVELIVGSTDKQVYVWDLPMSLKEEGMEWPMYQHDLYHTGCYGFGKGFMVDANGPYYARIDHPVEFRGSVVNGIPPYSWQWDFGDGNISTERNPVHTYDHLGNYQVNLTVCDGSGHCGFDADMVEVSSFGRVEYGAIQIKRIRGGFGVTAVVENKGSVNATDVQVTFTVETLFEMDEGGLIFPLNGERTKCVDIPAGKTRRVHCCIFHNPFFWPIVAYNVDVDVQIENCVDKETRLMIVSSCIVIPEDTPFPFGK
jgi:hypothetical protein